MLEPGYANITTPLLAWFESVPTLWGTMLAPFTSRRSPTSGMRYRVVALVKSMVAFAAAANAQWVIWRTKQATLTRVATATGLPVATLRHFAPSPRALTKVVSGITTQL
jgi:hypothetical protein